jgi:1-acyl-sn-glycerol-3-phosphate acyltransferase
MPKFYKPSTQKRIIREISRVIFRGIFSIFSKIKISGNDNIPGKGPYLVVFNHVSLYDPPFVVSFWPKQLEILGAAEVWNRKGQGILARLWGGIPINRTEIHRDALDQTLKVLRSDLPLLVSPEGGRSHQPGLRKAKTGIVYLAEQSQVPILPVGVVGTTDDFLQRALRWTHPKLEMKIGEPFSLPGSISESFPPQEIRQRKADYIMSKIAELLPASYRGYYGNYSYQ